jgi:2,3-dihydro-2,3-dihydroxybenzoate dehydrogenase
MLRQLMADHPNLDDLATGNLKSFRPAVPDAHVGRPDQVAAAVAFLLSPDSAHIAFHDLYLDGGETLGI